MRVRLLSALTVVVLAVLPSCGSGAERSGNAGPTPTTRPSTSASSPPGPPPLPSASTKKWIDLDVGDCLTEPPPTDPSVVTVSVVNCAASHMSEVFYRGALTVNAAIPEVANPVCSAQFAQYTGRSLEGSGLVVTYLVDSNQDRTTIDPTTGPAPSYVICLLMDGNGQPLTGRARRT